MQVRKIKDSDAKSYLKLCETIDEESEFMLFEPGERKLHAQRQIKQIESGMCEVFVCAADDGSLIGYVAAARGQVQRASPPRPCGDRHTPSVYRTRYWSKAFSGIGKMGL